MAVDGSTRWAGDFSNGWRFMTTTRAVLIGMVAFIGLVAGCGRPPTTAVVRGRVSVAGEPLSGGLIRFYARDTPARWSGATIEADGTYAVPDVPLGECVITVDTSNLKGLPRPQRVATASDAGDASAPQPEYRPIAAQYADVKSSPLAVEVKPGGNVHDFQVD